MDGPSLIDAGYAAGLRPAAGRRRTAERREADGATALARRSGASADGSTALADARRGRRLPDGAATLEAAGRGPTRRRARRARRRRDVGVNAPPSPKSMPFRRIADEDDDRRDHEERRRRPVADRGPRARTASGARGCGGLRAGAAAVARRRGGQRRPPPAAAAAAAVPSSSASSRSSSASARPRVVRLVGPPRPSALGSALRLGLGRSASGSASARAPARRRALRLRLGSALRLGLRLGVGSASRPQRRARRGSSASASARSACRPRAPSVSGARVSSVGHPFARCSWRGRVGSGAASRGRQRYPAPQAATPRHASRTAGTSSPARPAHSVTSPKPR